MTFLKASKHAEKNKDNLIHIDFLSGPASRIANRAMRIAASHRRAQIAGNMPCCLERIACIAAQIAASQTFRR